MRIQLFAILTAIAILASCKQEGTPSTEIDLGEIDLSETESVLNSLDTTGSGIPIFYNMYLSVELSSLFEVSGAVFDKDILNPTEKTSEYITSYKKAMNLGVYAVDLSYARVFEQYEVAGKYFSAMQNLSEQLGIPQNYFKETAERFERNLTQKDSLISIANEVYYKTEEHLKDNERFSTASIIIMGGWIEAIHIGSKVAIESKDPEIIERLIDQKYSLNNLLIMLGDHKDNEVIAEYFAQLEKLRGIFMNIEVEVPVDFNSNSPESKAQLASWIENLVELQKEIAIIRTSIVE